MIKIVKQLMADLAVIAIICGLAYLFGYLSNFSLYKAHVISHSCLIPVCHHYYSFQQLIVCLLLVLSLLIPR